MSLRLRSSIARIGRVGLFGAALSSAGVLAVAASAGSQSSNICSKVSASSVAAIVGYPMKAPTLLTRNIPASTSTDGVSGVYSICAYDTTTKAATLAGLQKEVNLSLETTSKALTIAELKQTASKAEAGTNATATVTSYPGLGHPALYLVVSGSGIVDQEITVLDGKTVYTANIANKNLPKAKLASLAKLAGKL